MEECMRIELTSAFTLLVFKTRPRTTLGSTTPYNRVFRQILWKTAYLGPHISMSDRPDPCKGLPMGKWCKVWDSNPGSLVSSTSAIPTSLTLHMEDMVGLEPTAYGLTDRRSHQLSYTSTRSSLSLTQDQSFGAVLRRTLRQWQWIRGSNSLLRRDRAILYHLTNPPH